MSDAVTETIGFVGCGKMGGALAQAFVNKGLVTQNQLKLYDKHQPTLDAAVETTGGLPVGGLLELCRGSEVVILATKPQDFPPLLTAIRDGDAVPAIVVSIAAGVRLPTLREALGPDVDLVRCMPNRPALVGAAVTALMGDDRTSAQSVDLVDRLLATAGDTVRLTDEALFDVVTGLSGSGPAYVFRLIEGLQAGGCANGLDPSTAKVLAVATVRGAAEILHLLDTSAEAERIAVSSPNGTTVAGLAALAKRDFHTALVEAVTAATNRSKELGS